MKIKQVEIYGINLPFIEPFIISYDTFEHAPAIIVKLTTSDGLEGFGECVLDEHVTGETFSSTIEILKHYLAPAIIGENPFHIERIHEKLNERVYGAPGAKAALDIACYDLMGKYAGQPIYHLLGGLYHTSIEIPFVLSIKSPADMAKDAAAAAAQGYQTIKVKIGTDVATDVQRVKRIRDAVGWNIKLRVDVNQGWQNARTSIHALKQLEDIGMDWIEQPVHADDFNGLAELRQNTFIPVMIDEGLHGSKDLLSVIEKKAADMINIKLMKCGGIFPALKLIHQAELAGIPVQIGSMVESSIATSAGAHLAWAKKNVLSNEMVGPKMFRQDIGNLSYDQNTLHPTSLPGLGVQVDEQAVEALTQVHLTVN